MSEAALAKTVVTELQRQGYETYEEVSEGYGCKRADIVAVRGPVVAVVECKAKLSMRLLDQLLMWHGGAHLIIGAHGWSRRSQSAERFCEQEGFGLWCVNGEEIAERVSPRLHRVAGVASLRRKLRPEQRSGEYAKAGTQGGYYTPFRQTCKALLDLVVVHPEGLVFKEALAQVGHHYASSRSALSALPEAIRNGLVPGVRFEDGKPPRVFPVSRL